MLSLLAYTYGKIVGLRNYLYDRNVLDSFDLDARTISVGNLTTGGTGKTPLVAYIAKVLADRGEKVCILTRGYGRDDENKRVLVSDGTKVLSDIREAGDEPIELAHKLIGKAIVIADADRIGAAEWAKRKLGATVFLLDDGFQHRRVRRGVDIVCIDATDPFSGRKFLPAGRLREPIEGLSRAHAVVITRADLVDYISDLKFEISGIAPGAAIFTSRVEFVGVDMRGKRAFAFCGIANSGAFFELLKRDDIDLVGSRSFPDHHSFSQDDIDDLHREARDRGAETFCTTAKDAVKLTDLKFEIPFVVAEIEVSLDDPERFAALL